MARETSISLKDFRAQLMSAKLANESRISSLTNSMSAMYVHSESSNSRSNGEQGRYLGESSNMGFGSYQEGSSQRHYSSQNKWSSNGSNRYAYGNNFTRPYSGNRYKGNNGFNQSGFNGSNGSTFTNGSKQGSNWQSWSGNTNYKSMVSP